MKANGLEVNILTEYVVTENLFPPTFPLLGGED